MASAATVSTNYAFSTSPPSVGRITPLAILPNQNSPAASHSDASTNFTAPQPAPKRPYIPGVAPIKEQYLINPLSAFQTRTPVKVHDDDAAEERTGPLKRPASTEPSDAVERSGDDDGTARTGDSEAGPSEPPKKLKGAARKKAKIAEAQAARAKAK